MVETRLRWNTKRMLQTTGRACAGLVLLLASTETVWAQVQVITAPVPSYDASTFVLLDDFDPDPDNPEVGLVMQNYTTSGGETFTVEDDVWMPGQGGVNGGGDGNVDGLFSTGQTLFGGVVRIISAISVSSGIVNVDSSIISLSSQTMAEVSTPVPLTVGNEAIVSGTGKTVWGREGVQEEWLYFQTWQTTGSIRIESDSEAPFQADFGSPERPQQATDTKVQTTPFYHELTLSNSAAISLELSAMAGIIDGSMPPQGDVPREDWPQVNASTQVVVNVMPFDYGSEPIIPLRPEISDTWLYPTTNFLQSTAPILGDVIEGVLEGWFGSGDGNGSASPTPLAALTEPTAGPTSDDRPMLAMYLYLPGDSYYEVPFPDQDVQTFLTPPEDLILGISDFQFLPTPVRIIADGVDLGEFSNGDSVDFVALLGHGVNAFDVVSSQTGVSDAWVMGLQFSSVAPFVLVVPSPIPEPGSLAVLAAGCAVLLRRRRVA